MATRNDVPLAVLRSAAARGRETAMERVVQHGGELVYVLKGRLVAESADGQIRDLGESTAKTVTLKQRKWKIG